MKILVTGGAGFIGSNFIHYWLQTHPGDQIINFDLLTYAGNIKNLEDISSNPNYTFVKGDIADAEQVNSLMPGVDLIVNFAAETHVDRSIKDSADFIRTNVEGTRVLLEAAKNNGGIRFHHISTDEVFGSLGKEDEPFNELTPYDPRSPYSAAKASSDHLVRAYYHTYGLSVTISNCSNNYGPYQYTEKMIPLFITNLLQGKKIPLYGTGENVRDWIHVDDHNRGVAMIIEQGKIGETYCLGGGNEKNNLSLTKFILGLMEQSEDMIEYIADRPGHDLRYAINFSKAKRELGWQPQVDFIAGLRATVEWYKNNQAWWQNIDEINK
ncbi:dTDP-glucose 4,6-dehydratase [Candidatus Falkowbacteria bacterium]|uniref:dTDP-glucose 4,6-dehydratase n=1 Tax=Candidatus Falkowbacteria bacterium CG10_big_fil_rev_8_21_14_0_10_37_18 TaxID=1974562 RepID=A0A2H0V8U0_9BACT|nr:dTDP-glucose 4,6-dehydratase [Candidatus Falkowbacteria bacterium]NCQ12590.1 dTDP-glucose 4,6-dehydratase [Candidatus Falkowbacteria bacterium]OIO05582.1 MAG: dTDP-glucose 4,6-dehydratase [Candidatus Falkowbacteria bacterium CG1_02_37_21]PIR95481.1 MAG: dTDP-glucose 4,6-dehydratase [Candidatus Falkowbacteria bacterium CG10_big_fil_rev_8_21_14_0_10_37_18]